MKILFKEELPLKREILFNDYSLFIAFFEPYIKEIYKNPLTPFYYEAIHLNNDLTPRKKHIQTKEHYINALKGHQEYINRKIQEKSNIKANILKEIESKIDLKGYEVILKIKSY